ncbi:MAG: hypothetical protein IPP43_13660 [Chitinophagaceae bacterium]|nr:hypothetical protein [Chitinophagaceae bacterium]
MEKELAVQRERERITADLHDDVGATLSSMHIWRPGRVGLGYPTATEQGKW